jgi:serine phosphatase RsbU (regulator of sigma subunit)
MNAIFRILAVLTCLIIYTQLSAQNRITIFDGSNGIVGSSILNDTAQILSILKKSPADRAGLRFRDRIISVDGMPVSGNGLNSKLLKKLLTTRNGDSLHLVISRPGSDSLFSVHLKSDEQLQEMYFHQYDYLVDSLQQWDIRNILVADSTLSFKDPRESKCRVWSVDPDSKAGKMGLRAGDLIISLAEEVDRASDYNIGMPRLYEITQDTSLTLLRDSIETIIDLDPSAEGSLAGVQSEFRHDMDQSCVWLKIQTEHLISEDRTYLFSFREMARKGTVSFYEISDQGAIIEKDAGIELPAKYRDFNYKDWMAISVHLEKDELQTHYAKLVADRAVGNPVFMVIAQETITSHDRIERLILSAFYGMMLIISLYYLILFLSTSHRRFLFFALYILSFALMLFSFEGFPGEFAWVNIKTYLAFSDRYDFILMSLVSVFFLLFGTSYLELRKSLKGWYRVIISLVALIILINILFAINTSIERDLGIYEPIVALSFVFGAVLIPMFILVVPTLLRIRMRSRASWYFLIANVLLVVCVILSFNHTGSKFTIYTLYRSTFATMMLISAVYIAAVSQFLLFSVGLAQKMKVDEREKELAQKRVIEQLRENEKLKDKVNRELEQKVQERTREITTQKEEIETQRDEIEAQRDEIEAQRDQLQGQKDILEAQNQQITDSISYAERIQAAVMPHEDFMEDVMPEHFVLFKPRDIVSGDFYWIKQLEDTLIAVVADCTGHGVPGAFMSMLGIALLNEEVGGSRPLPAGEILNGLRAKVKEILAQEGKAYEQRDGMEMALVQIKCNTMDLLFAGAYNPVYIIRHKDGSGKKDPLGDYRIQDNASHILYELKGDRQPVAIHALETEFTTTRLKLKKGDSIYLFSDGYIDQKGGPMNKKFLSRNFKKLLLEIQGLDMKAQKNNLEKTLVDWQGDLEQIDDILVMGIRV